MLESNRRCRVSYKPANLPLFFPQVLFPPVLSFSLSFFFRRPSIYYLLTDCSPFFQMHFAVHFASLLHDVARFLKGVRSTDPRQVETSVASHGRDNVSPVQPQEGPFRSRDFFFFYRADNISTRMSGNFPGRCIAKAK